jgi:multidrug resistance efflux pump
VVELGTSLENATAQSRAGEAQIAHLKDQVRQLTQKIQQETSKASSERSMRDAMLDLRQEELALQLDLQERELVSARSERDEAHAALVRVQVDSEAQITQLRASREQLQDDLKRADDSARRMSVQYDSEAAKCENLQVSVCPLTIFPGIPQLATKYVLQNVCSCLRAV